MRKRILEPDRQDANERDGPWLDLEQVAEVEITSEDTEHPIERALVPGAPEGWVAGGPGEQTIRLLFPEPQSIRRVRLHFEETELERTQQFVLRWSPDGGHSFREAVRQQWNFSPGGACRETEDIHLGIPDVTVLELVIIPDIGGGPARASLAQLRIEPGEPEAG
ncbi:carbohydrate-binding protein [Thioalkalivibrio sp.]|uniref:carbohydrate-binding protein n=1 Tax=Thioalkalivibrio sp. TaxID=2093813 RepID=UPI003565C8B9